MRTTINIDANLVSELVRVTGEKDRGKAVNTALAEFLRRRRLEELRSLRGNIEIEDNLDELEQLELDKMRRQP